MRKSELTREKQRLLWEELYIDYIVIGLLIVLTSLVSAVLYACCVMSGKIDKLAEQRNVNEDLEELKKEKELGNY